MLRFFANRGGGGGPRDVPAPGLRACRTLSPEASGGLAFSTFAKGKSTGGGWPTEGLKGGRGLCFFCATAAAGPNRKKVKAIAAESGPNHQKESSGGSPTPHVFLGTGPAFAELGWRAPGFEACLEITAQRKPSAPLTKGCREARPGFERGKERKMGGERRERGGRRGGRGGRRGRREGKQHGRSPIGIVRWEVECEPHRRASSGPGLLHISTI